MKWSIALYKEYRELHYRNYELNNLYGVDEKFSRLVVLEQFFRPIDNISMLLDELEKARAVIKLCDEQMDWYKDDIASPTSWADVHSTVKEYLSK